MHPLSSGVTQIEDVGAIARLRENNRRAAGDALRHDTRRRAVHSSAKARRRPQSKLTVPWPVVAHRKVAPKGARKVASIPQMARQAVYPGVVNDRDIGKLPPMRRSAKSRAVACSRGLAYDRLRHHSATAKQYCPSSSARRLISRNPAISPSRLQGRSHDLAHLPMTRITSRRSAYVVGHFKITSGLTYDGFRRVAADAPAQVRKWLRGVVIRTANGIAAIGHDHMLVMGAVALQVTEAAVRIAAVREGAGLESKS